MGVNSSKTKKRYSGTNQIVTPAHPPPSNEVTDKKPKRNVNSNNNREDKAMDRKLEQLFESYEDALEECMNPEGVMRFLEDLELDPEDPKVLVLAYKLGADRMGYFDKEPFVAGLKTLGVDSIVKLKEVIPSFEADLADPDSLKEIYKFAFKFYREPPQKNILLNIAIAILELLVPDRPHVKMFCKFLKEQTDYLAMNSDQWSSFYEFSSVVNEDFESYDENSAWPVLLDQYVEWAKSKRNSE